MSTSHHATKSLGHRSTQPSSVCASFAVSTSHYAVVRCMAHHASLRVPPTATPSMSAGTEKAHFQGATIDQEEAGRHDYCARPSGRPRIAADQCDTWIRIHASVTRTIAQSSMLEKLYTYPSGSVTTDDTSDRSTRSHQPVYATYIRVCQAPALYVRTHTEGTYMEAIIAFASGARDVQPTESEATALDRLLPNGSDRAHHRTSTIPDKCTHVCVSQRV